MRASCDAVDEELRERARYWVVDRSPVSLSAVADIERPVVGADDVYEAAAGADDREKVDAVVPKVVDAGAPYATGGAETADARETGVEKGDVVVGRQPDRLELRRTRPRAGAPESRRLRGGKKRARDGWARGVLAAQKRNGRAEDDKGRH